MLAEEPLPLLFMEFPLPLPELEEVWEFEDGEKPFIEEMDWEFPC